MLLALDTHYWEEEGSARARAAGVIFEDWQAGQAARELAVEVPDAAPYQPGSFYLRELPGLMALIRTLDVLSGIVIIDGYVWLGGYAAGLGAHLWDALDREVAVVGVAKSGFQGTPALAVYRRDSGRPLFISAAGISVEEAARDIIFMHGENRLPTMLKLADNQARQGLSR